MENFNLGWKKFDLKKNSNYNIYTDHQLMTMKTAGVLINIFVMVFQYLDELLTQLSDIVEKHSDVDVSGACVVLVNVRIRISVACNFFSQKNPLDHVH